MVRTMQKRWWIFGLSLLSHFTQSGHGAIFGVVPAVAGEAMIEIELNKTAETTDDYLTWAPMPSRIHLLERPADGNPVIVVLTNDAERPARAGRDQPLDGNFAFADSVLAGQTATLSTLKLTLPADRSWVSFTIAGSFPRASTADKDAVMEAHLGDASGPVVGSLAAMVRVRKNVDTLTIDERNAFLKALHDLQVEAKSYETFPKMHDLAAKGKSEQILLPDGTPNPKFWPDQAHRGSAFLPWHRAFLLLLERRLQSINPAVTIPYWRQNAPTKAFDPMFLGTNRRADNTFQTEVVFSPANWLYGWSIGYQDLKTVVRASKDFTAQLKLPNGTGLRGDVELFGGTPVDPTYDKFHGNFEFNPHNMGHALLGAWHANCLISPADPSFWPFHAEDDRLWAMWQWFHGRFDPEGSNESYDFRSVFVPNDSTTTNLGHNLKDTMWPWDGTKGRVFDDQNGRGNRPDENPFSAFPKAPAEGLWPTSDAKPTPADVIDYLGLSPARMPHGVAYDDVPYGIRAQPIQPPPPTPSVSIADVLAETARDNLAPADRRKAALSLLRATARSRPDTVFETVASDSSAPPPVRREAAVNLIYETPAEGMAAVLALIERRDTASAELTSAAIETSSFAHRANMPVGVNSKLHELLMKSAADLSDPQAVPAAIALAQMSDPHAPAHLLALIKSDKVGDATRAALIAALPLTAAGSIPTLREFLEKALRDNDVETALLALRGLAGDPDSRVLRLSLVDDANMDSAVRRAAMRSLMHETTDAIPKLLTVIEGPPSSTRLEAVGAFRVTLESFRPFSHAQVDDWKNRMRAVSDGASSSAVELKGALSIVLEVLEHSAG